MQVDSTRNVLTITYECARGYLWTEEIKGQDFGAALLQAAAACDAPRLSAMIDGWVDTGGDQLELREVKYFIDRGVPEDLLIKAARRLGRYELAREIKLYTVSADA